MKRRPGQRNCIFLCSDLTCQECLDKNLFGGSKDYEKVVKRVDPGDSLFLYNYSSQSLLGEFEAVSETALNIDSKAWIDSVHNVKKKEDLLAKGESPYPWQVRVKRIHDYIPLSRTEIEKYIPFPDKFKFPVASLKPWQVEQLQVHFQSPIRIVSQETDYRKKNPASYFTEDGHCVRSYAEMTIDNWLYRRRISHGYECHLPIPEPAFCDFYIPIDGTDKNVYIEYWGRTDKRYQERREYKISLYNQHTLPLVELVHKDLKNLDEILIQKLSQHFSIQHY